MASGDVTLVKEHHKQGETCASRPSYREGRWEKAVKVYTVNQESRYLLIQNVPALGVTKDLLELFSLYGAIEEYRLLDEYPAEPYTDVYWIKYVNIDSARVAKRRLDGRSFFGSSLHVCYAPEYESVQDTRDKLAQRKKVVLQKTRQTGAGGGTGAVDQDQGGLRGLGLPMSASAAVTTTVGGGSPLPLTTTVGGGSPLPLSHQLQPVPPTGCEVVVPGLPPLPPLPPPSSPLCSHHHAGQVLYPSMRPVEATTVGTSGRKQLVGCGRGGGSGYRSAGLSTSDRVALYVESSSTGVAMATIHDAGTTLTASSESKVNVTTESAPVKKRRRI